MIGTLELVIKRFTSVGWFRFDDARCRYVEGPGENQRYRKAQYRGDYKKTQGSFRKAPGGEEHVGDLNNEPGAHNVETGHPVNTSSSQFPPKTHILIMD